MRKIGLTQFIENEFVWNCHTQRDNIQMSLYTLDAWIGMWRKFAHCAPSCRCFFYMFTRLFIHTRTRQQRDESSDNDAHIQFTMMA